MSKWERYIQYEKFINHIDFIIRKHQYSDKYFLYNDTYEVTDFIGEYKTLKEAKQAAEDYAKDKK